MNKIKITIEQDGKEEVFECNQYWLFFMSEEGENSSFQHKYKANELLFRTLMTNHMILSDRANHMGKMKDHEEYREEHHKEG